MSEADDSGSDLMLRLLNRLVDRIGKQTLLTWTLLMMMLGSLAYGLAGVVRGLDVWLLLLVSILALLCGWAIGRLPLPPWKALSLWVGLGVLVTGEQVGRLWGQTFRLVTAANGLILQHLGWRGYDLLPDGTPMLTALAGLGGSFGTLLARVASWVTAAWNATPVYDPVATTILWCLAVWLVSAWAGWVICRWGQLLLGSTPATALLAISLAYAGGSPVFLLLLLGSLFLLLAWTGYGLREKQWLRAGIDFSEDLRYDVAMVTFGLSAALVAVAAFSQNLSLDKLADLVDRFSPAPAAAPAPLAESLGLQPRPGKVSPEGLAAMRRGGLPRHHLLGSGPELSEQIVMEVETGDFQPGPADYVVTRPLPHYYWRSLSYDQYLGNGWASSQLEILGYAPDQAALQPAEPPAGSTAVKHSLRKLGEPNDLVYVAGDLLALNVEYQAAWRIRPDPARPDNGDLFGATSASMAYEVRSLLPVASEEQLRAAGSVYPEWVRARYLGLPESVPQRVLSLARDLTATEPTPFDRARAIEAYLRTYPYNLQVSAPPLGRDVADYFLFDLKEGYCDYYATAMVVLARAAGLPARLAMGYAGGQYDSIQARYRVTEADAHSWPEIYFPGYGWVGFEPTAGRAVIDRSAVVQAEPAPEPAAAPPAGPAQPDWLRLLGWTSVVVGLLVLGLSSWSASEGWRLRRMSPEAALAIVYGQLHRRGVCLRVPHHRGDTPYEFGSAFEGEIERLAQGKRWAGWVAPARQEISQITEMYARAAYSPRSPGTEEQQQVIKIWQRLRWRLWLARAKRILL